MMNSDAWQTICHSRFVKLVRSSLLCAYQRYNDSQHLGVSRTKSLYEDPPDHFFRHH